MKNKKFANNRCRLLLWLIVAACLLDSTANAKKWGEVKLYIQGLSYGHQSTVGTGFAYANLANATVYNFYPNISACTGGNCPAVPANPITTAQSTAKLEVDRPYILTVKGNLVYSGSVFCHLAPCFSVDVTAISPPGGDPITGAGDSGSGVQLAPATSTTATYSVTLRFTPGPVNFGSSCECADTPLPQLVADGRQRILAWVDGVNSTQWSFDGPNLDCKIIKKFLYNGNSYAVVQSGHIEGEVHPKLTDGTCEYHGRLALVCASGGCDGPRCTGFGKGAFQNNQGIDFRLTTGGDENARAAGSLRLVSGTAGPSLASPASLTAALESNNSEWIRDENGTLRQVKSAMGLIDVVTINPYKYELRCYNGSDLNGSQYGLYTVSGGSVPAVTWTVQNPDTSGSTFNQLWVTENRTGMTAVTMKYTFTSSDGKWTLEDDQGLSKRTSWQTVVGSVRSVYEEVLQGSTVVSRRSEQFEPVGGVEVLKKVVLGQGSTETTTYSYYSSSGNGDNNDQLMQIDYPDGRWDRFNYDAQGRVITKWESWRDQGPTSNASLCRSTEYSYDSVAPAAWGDTGAYRPDLPRRTIRKVLGGEVGRSYMAAKLGKTEYQNSSTPGAAWDAAGNERRVETTFTSGSYEGKLQSVTEVNGTMAIYSYAPTGANLVTTTDRGQANASGTAIILGTRRVETVSQTGLPISVVERLIGGVADNQVVDSQTYSYADGLGESYTITRLGGAIEQVSNGCCGASSIIDADGRKTERISDAINRPVSTKTYVDNGVNAITVINTLDAAGRPVETRRIGTDGSSILQRTVQYDTLGHALLTTNAFGGRTTTSETMQNNKRSVTTTFPDGGTRMENYYRDGRLESVAGTAASPIRYYYGTLSDSGSLREYTLEQRLDATGTSTNEWTQVVSDGLGRKYMRVLPYGNAAQAVSQQVYNNKGQLIKSVDEDGVTTLLTYDELGQTKETVIDMANPGTIDYAGSDRIVQTLNDVSTKDVYVVRRQRRYEWPSSANSSVLLSTQQSSVDGLRTWSDGLGLASSSVTVYAGNGTRNVTTTAPDGSYEVTVYSYGRRVSSTRRDSAGSQLGATTFGYDAHGRESTRTDARTGTTVTSYNAGDVPTTITSPSAGNGEAAQMTTLSYDTSGRLVQKALPDGGVEYQQYYQTGLLRKRWGSRVYPVEYAYDVQGRMIWMKTWKSLATDAGTNYTAWNYNPYRGWLDNKRYADGKGPDYTYTAAGRLSSRIWARNTAARITTTYAYNTAGDLAGIDYSDSTPDVTYGYDRRGRRNSIIQNGMTTTISLTDGGLVNSEAYTGGVLGGYSLENTFDLFLRRKTATAKAAGSAILTYDYTYDAASRLSSVGQGTKSVVYAYLANSPLVEQATFKDNTNVRMVTTRKYDNLNRLVSISSGTSATAVPHTAYAYSYNDANQRIRNTQQDGSHWVYEYDSLGQVISGKRLWADGTPVAGQQFEYRFDDIGNRTQTQTGGDATGQNLRTANYAANSLNQYMSRDVPRILEVQGLAAVASNVTVNGSSSGVYRKGEYFRKELDLTGNNAAVWQSINVAAGGSGSASGKRYLPPQPETYTYDDDGNTLTDGRWTYTWDAENRLISLTSLASAPAGSKYQLNFVYDAQGRRIQKTVSTHNGTTYVPVSTNRFLYDGWNVVAQPEATTGVATRLYLWGLDLSGSEQGAGGVGGLVAEGPPAGVDRFVAYDGNGNVTVLTSASDGTLTARYDYGPFGEVQRASGADWQKNPFRFSTKWQDEESDLLYYGYRYYFPWNGRWLSRDPLGLDGGESEYALLSNDDIGSYDLLGMIGFCDCSCGNNVTKLVLTTLNNISGVYKSTGRKTRLSGCYKLITTPWSWNSWDMLEILGYSPPTSDVKDGRTDRCRECLYKVYSNEQKVPSVTFYDNCYTTSAVNYVMYGFVMRLCNNSFGLSGHFGPGVVAAYVVGGKLGRLHVDELETATRLALAGYNFDFSKLPRSQLPCVGSSKDVMGNPNNWHWDDIHDRRNE